jgi:hypothetical protein
VGPAGASQTVLAARASVHQPNLFGPDTSDSEESEDEEEPVDVFQHFTGLEGFQLSGLRTALTAPVTQAPAEDRETAIWKGSRGTVKVAKIKTNKILKLYENMETLPVFKAPEVPANLDLSQRALGKDEVYAKRQNALGTVARAVTRGLVYLEKVVQDLSALEDPRLTAPADDLKEKATVPLAHALRLLASEFNEIAFKRCENAAASVPDERLKKELRRLKPGFDTVFEEPIVEKVEAAENRSQRRLLQEALQGKSRRVEHPKSRPRGRDDRGHGWKNTTKQSTWKQRGQQRDNHSSGSYQHQRPRQDRRGQTGQKNQWSFRNKGQSKKENPKKDF